MIMQHPPAKAGTQSAIDWPCSWQARRRARAVHRCTEHGRRGLFCAPDSLYRAPVKVASNR